MLAVIRIAGIRLGFPQRTIVKAGYDIHKSRSEAPKSQRIKPEETMLQEKQEMH